MSTKSFANREVPESPMIFDKKSDEKLEEKSDDKSNEKLEEKSDDKSNEKSLEKSDEKSDEKSNEKSNEKLEKKSDDPIVFVARGMLRRHKAPKQKVVTGRIELKKPQEQVQYKVGHS